MPTPWINTLQHMLILLPSHLLPEIGPNGEHSINSSPLDPPLQIERAMNEWARNHYTRRPWKNYLFMDNMVCVNHNKAPGILILHKDRWLSLFPKADYLLALTRFRKGIPPLHTWKVISRLGHHWSIVRPDFAHHMKFGCDHLDTNPSPPDPPISPYQFDITTQDNNTTKTKGKARPSKKARNRKKTQTLIDQ